MGRPIEELNGLTVEEVKELGLSQGEKDTKAGRQYLILPLNISRLIAGLKASGYTARYGLTHFGHDNGNNGTTLYSCGRGRVIAAGWDSIVGNTVVVRYENVRAANYNIYSALTVRYLHLSTYKVSVGQIVTKDSVIGIMGNTGMMDMATHLHIEIDSDPDERWACYSPTVKGKGGVLMPGTDTVVNPGKTLCIKTNSPDNQTYTVDSDQYFNGKPYFTSEDKCYAVVSTVDAP